MSGEAEAGSTITIKDPSGNVVGEGKADSDGKFSIDLTAPQLSGEQLTVTATDDAGNTGPSATIDAPNIPLPDTPAITAAIDDAAPLTGTLSNNQFTNDNTPTLEGTGSAGTVIHIYANGQEIGSTTVDSSGSWRFAITSALADGENHFTAIATNVKGESSESARFTLTIDTLSPDAPRVELIADNTGLLTGPLQNNDRTDEAKPLFSGQGEAGNTITIKEGSTVIGSATVDENGRWTFTPTTPLSDGEHTFTVEQSDKAGNTSRVTTTPTIIVDTTPPDAAIIDNVAKDGTTVSGTAETGSTVSIYDPAGNCTGSTITGENNHFSITLNPAQTHGERLEARIQDAVGNIGPATEFTASDSQYPAQPTILTVTDDAGAVTGLLKMAMPQMITAQPSAVLLNQAVRYRLTIMAFLYRPFRPLSLTLTANGALPPRWHLPMATMFLPLPRPTIAAPAGSPSPLPLISTRSRRCWKARRLATSATDLPALRKLAVLWLSKTAVEIRSVVERQATTVPSQ